MKIAEIIPEEEYVTCERIMNICRRVGIPYMKTEAVKYRTHPSLITNRGWEDSHEVYSLHESPTIATGYSDYNVGANEMDVVNIPTLKAWFGNNIDTRHPTLVAVPLGVPIEKYQPVQGNTRTLYSVSEQRKDKRHDKLAYMNFRLDTYYEERKRVVDMFSNEEWVTTGTLDASEEGHKNYLKDIRDHKFCFSPRGNGVDCHRIYECLYLGTIPIVKRAIALEQFSDLPILFIDEWTDVTPEMLQTVWDEYVDKEWDMSKVLLSCWAREISSTVTDHRP
jgi:hypothetical protein